MKTAWESQLAIVICQCIIVLLCVQLLTACRKQTVDNSHESIEHQSELEGDHLQPAIEPPPSPPSPPSPLPLIEYKNGYRSGAGFPPDHKYEKMAAVEAAPDHEYAYMYGAEAGAAPEHELVYEYVPKNHVAFSPITKSELKSTFKKTNKHETKIEKFKEYIAHLGADPTITIPGSPGRLKVSIGIPGYTPNFPEGMARASGTLHATGATAKVTPFAPAFKIEPKESVCMKLDPAGSEVSFVLTPTRGGVFDVGADVYLYDSNDCNGPATPKGTTTLKVQVIVKIIPDTDSIKDVIRQMLLKFWGEILMLVSAVVLFILRKKLKRWIGFGKEK